MSFFVQFDMLLRDFHVMSCYFYTFFRFVSSKCKEILIYCCPKWKKISDITSSTNMPINLMTSVLKLCDVGLHVNRVWQQNSRSETVRLCALHTVIVSSLYNLLLVSPFSNKPHFQSLSSCISDNSFPAPCCHVGFVYGLNSK